MCAGKLQTTCCCACYYKAGSGYRIAAPDYTLNYQLDVPANYLLNTYRPLATACFASIAFISPLSHSCISNFLKFLLFCESVEKNIHFHRNYLWWFLNLKSSLKYCFFIIVSFLLFSTLLFSILSFSIFFKITPN